MLVKGAPGVFWHNLEWEPSLEWCVYQYSTLTAMYRQVSNIRRALVGNKTVDHSDVIGASPVGAAPTTSSFST